MLLFMFCAMAAQALSVALLGRKILETDDFAYISSSFHMLGAGTVTGFTAMAILKSRFEMRSLFKAILVQVLVTGLTRISTNVLGFRSIGRTCVLFLGSYNKWKKNRQQDQCVGSRAVQSFENCFHIHGWPFASGQPRFLTPWARSQPQACTFMRNHPPT